MVGITSSSYLLFLHFSMRALVTTKGQVTIPKELREKLGIKPGSEVDFVAGSDGIRLRKVVDSKQAVRCPGLSEERTRGAQRREVDG